MTDRPHRSLEEVLTVVDDHQRRLVGEVAPDHFLDGTPFSGAQPPHRADRRQDHRRVVDGSQFDQPCSVGLAAGEAAGGFHRQTRLAGSPHSGEDDQSVVVEETVQFGQFGFPSDERAGVSGKVVVGSDSPQRRGHRRQVRVADFEYVFGVGEVFETMSAVVFQVRRVDSPGGVGGGGRQQHLAAVAGCHDPGGSVDGRPEVVAAAFCGVSSVDSHPHSQRGARPSRPGQTQLHADRRGHGGERRGEGHSETVTGGGEDVAAVGFHGALDQRVVGFDALRHPRRVGFPQVSGPLDVGEQESDRPGGRCHGESVPTES